MYGTRSLAFKVMQMQSTVLQILPRTLNLTRMPHYPMGRVCIIDTSIENSEMKPETGRKKALVAFSYNPQ